MYRLNIGRDLYLKGRIGWKGLSKDEYLEKSDYKIINATALMDGFVDWGKCGYISKERYDESEEIMLQENDILISKDGTLGKIGYVKGLQSYCTVASGIFVLRNTKPTEVNFDYLYHLLKSNIFKNWIKANKAEGSTINHLYQCDLERFEIDLPCLAQQEGIAKILNDIDDKIALNRSMNQTLEAMAKQLYDYWFVQFDFPDKNGKPYKSSGGKMVWNEKLKREIPEGWNDGKLSEIANITMGQSPEGSSYNDNGNGILFYQGSTDFGMRFPSVRQYTTSPTRYARKGDILMSVRAPVGAINIANNDCCIGRGLSALNSKIGSMTHLYFIIDGLRVAFERQNSTGTTFGSITKDDLFELPVVVPRQNIIDAFEKVCRTIYDKQMNLGEEVSSLTTLRDNLLPLLMNGQVTIKN
ncbi:MAG: restriction endonuclease subunit S [Bacteroidales bacterium]|nr:restriction endonuclease subunit S [Bacteroidales bacterium]